MNLDKGPQMKQLENKVKMMMKGSCLWTWDNNTYARLGSLDHLETENSRKGIRAKERTKVDQQEPEEPSLVGEEQAHGSELWSEEDGVWWSKGNEATKASA